MKKNLFKSKISTIVLICGLIFIFIILVPAIALMNLDSTSKTQYADAKREFSIYEEHFKNAINLEEYGRGNGLSSFLNECAGVRSCPLISGKWLIPVTPGDEEKFINNILVFNNYKIDHKATCSQVNDLKSCTGDSKKIIIL